MNRVTVLAALAGLFCFALLPACTGDGGSARAQGRAPEDVVRAFIQAARAGDPSRFEGLLTPRAYAGLTSRSGRSIDATGWEKTEVRPASIDGVEARVPVSVTRRGETQELELHLRRESAGWQIHALSVDRGGNEMTVDFETIAETMDAMAETMANEMQRAFQEAMEKQRRAERAQKKLAFESLRALSPSELETTGRNTVDLRGRSLSAALEILCDGLGLELDSSGHEATLTREVTRDVRGLSFAAAAESLCRDAGLHPLFPEVDPALLQSGENPSLTLRLAAGPRPGTIAFPGPFVATVIGVDQNVPFATGKVEVGMTGYNLDPACLSLLEALTEKTSFQTVVGPEGQELRADPNVRYVGGGQRAGRHWVDSTRLELRGLLRSVDALARIEGTQHLAFPTEVFTTELVNLKPGHRETVGPFTVTVKETGESVGILFEGSETDLEGLVVRGWPRDASGEDARPVFETTNVWGRGKAMYQLQAEPAPARLELKIVTGVQSEEYAFRLENVPLDRHQEMPERLEPLDFSGASGPVEVGFEGFDRPENQMPVAKLTVRNHSNKAVGFITAKFIYLDGNQKTLKDFPHTIQGQLSMAGPSTLVDPHGTVTSRTTAFFMPDETKGLRIQIERVEFMDGTVWNATD